MIDRRISNSKKLGIINDRARVMWVWLYVYTDKEGRVKFDDIDDLIQDCIPRFQDYSIESVVKAIEDLDKVDLLVLYPYKDRLHPTAFALQFERFRDFQKIRDDREGRSRVPEPPEHARIKPGVPREHYSFTPLLSLSLSLSKEVSKEIKKEKKAIDELMKFKQSIYNELIKVKGLGHVKAEKLVDFIIVNLMPEFPDVDVIESIKKKCAWWLDNPLTKTSNIHAQMRNWFKLGQKWINEAKAGDRVGKGRPQKPKTKDEIECERLVQTAEDKILKANPGKRGREIECLVIAARAKASQEFWRKNEKK